MLRRNRRQPTATATGGIFCRLCGIDVELDSLGRCRLGHRVSAPGELRDETPTGPDAWLTEADDLDYSVARTPDASEAEPAYAPSIAPTVIGSTTADSAADDGLEDAAMATAHRATVIDDTPTTSRDRDATTASTGDSREDNGGESERAKPSTAAAVGSRERLLEAASWFSMGDDS